MNPNSFIKKLSAKNTFVTVVSVDEDEETSEKENIPVVLTLRNESSSLISKQFHNSEEENITMVDSLQKGKTPKPAPRQFVTVVSVGETRKVEMGGQMMVSMENSLKLRLDVPGDATDEQQQRINYSPPNVVEKFLDSHQSLIPDQVVVFRLPGERLGLGLKFDGGMTVSETVKRLFIQSVAPDSPAARASVPWGDLEIGDQILHIEGKPVSSMTRVECVSRLKEASVKLTIGVLKGNGIIPDAKEASPPILGTKPAVSMVRGRIKRIPPPPIPPRSLGRKSPARPPKESSDITPPPQGFDDLDEPGSKMARYFLPPNYHEDYEGETNTYMPSSHRHIAHMPPAPAVYLDLLSEEEKVSRARCESESDETNSSASTVIDRLSISSSRTVSRNSSFNAAADAAKFDLTRALTPFESLEKEMNNSEKRQRSLSTPHLTYSGSFSSPSKKNVDISSEVIDIPSDNLSSKHSPKNLVKTTMKSFSFSLKSRPFSWHSSKQENTDSLSLSKKNGKRQAPLPPPRSADSCLSTMNSLLTSASISEVRPDYFNLRSEIMGEEQDVFERGESPSIIEVESFESSELLEPIVSETDAGMSLKQDEDTAVISKLTYVDNKCYELAEKMSTENNLAGELSTSFARAGEPLASNYPTHIEVDDANKEEPLDTDSYECKKLFFIDHATNPSYGLPPLLEDLCSTSSTSRSDTENQEGYYEEIDSSSESTDVHADAKRKFLSSALEGKAREALGSDFNSSFSQSSTSISSRELEELNAEEEDQIQLKDSSDTNKFMIDSEVFAETQDDYEYIRIDDEESKTCEASHKRFSLISRDVRLRKDLCELLKKDLELGNDAQIEIEEEEVVESFVECQTEEEILLVLRALQNNNSFSLDERSDDNNREHKNEETSSLFSGQVGSVTGKTATNPVNSNDIGSDLSSYDEGSSNASLSLHNVNESFTLDTSNNVLQSSCRDKKHLYEVVSTCSVPKIKAVPGRYCGNVDNCSDNDQTSFKQEISTQTIAKVLNPCTRDFHSRDLRNCIKMLSRNPSSETVSAPTITYSDEDLSSEVPPLNIIAKTKSPDSDSACDPSLTFATSSYTTDEDDLGLSIAVPQNIFTRDTDFEDFFPSSRENNFILENITEETLEEPSSPSASDFIWAQSEQLNQLPVQERFSLDQVVGLSPVPEAPELLDEGKNNFTGS